MNAALDAYPPPVGITTNASAQTLMTVTNAVFAAVVVAASVHLLVKRRDPTLLPFAVLGGAFASLNEAQEAHLLHWYYYEVGQWTLYTSSGTHIPTWSPGGYIWFYGGIAYIAAHHIQRHGRQAAIWTAVGLFTGATVFDLVGINLGSWEYYGFQPARVFGMPMWISELNTVVVVLAAVALASFRDNLRGPRGAIAALILPAANAVGFYGAGLPLITALNSELPDEGVIWLAYLITSAIAVGIVAAACSVVPRRPTAEAVPGPRPRATVD